MPVRRSGLSVLLCFLVLTGPVDADDGIALDVLALQPAPNYPLTLDDGDADQLTDGHSRRFPFWTRRESVGWQKRTPILITARSRLMADARYELVLRTGQRLRASVQVPRRIDVYCGAASADGMTHVGELIPEQPPFYYDGRVDLVVPFSGCSGNLLQIAVHAQGSYLMLDQLMVHRRDSVDRQKLVRAGTVTNDSLADSRTRLEVGLLSRAREKLLRSLTQTITTAGSQAWLDGPWTDLDGTVGQPGLALTVLPTHAPAWILGIANTGTAQRRFRLEQEDASHGAAAVSYLPPLLTADGRLVFDALLPAEAEHWMLAPGQLAYFLLHEPVGASAGQRSLRISDDAGWSRTLEVQVDVLDRIQPAPQDTPRLLVWSYTFDRPIWRADNAGDLVQALTDAGVNVFVIPPTNIPLPFDQKDRERRLDALRADLSLYRGRGLILLFTGSKVTWHEIKMHLKDPAGRAAIQSWAVSLAKFMVDAGIPSDQWALYPVDEIHGEDLVHLAELIELVKQKVPNLQFYANPVAARGDVFAQIFDLQRLGPLIAYWQPRAGAAFKRVRSILEESGSPKLWLYDNPCEPARATSPDWYRALGRRAHDARAKGLGFWSFSATSGSSAWNDLDGVRPDWAVVYETKNGFVSSRRWEAARAGVQDYAALSFCARQAQENNPLVAQCVTHHRSLPSADTGCRDWRRGQ